MAKDSQATQADEPAVDPQEATEQPEENKEELSREDQQVEDALLAVNGDIKGELKPNRPLDEDISEEPAAPDESTVIDEEPEATEQPEEEVEAAPDITPEADDAGVYAPITAVDPGEFKAGDYSFTVQTTDGKSHKISTPEEADEFATQLDEHPELISASQFMSLGRKTATMEQSIARDQQAYETQKAEFTRQQENTQVKDKTIEQWNGEMNYLTANDKLPAVPSAIDVPGGWEKNPNDPGVKARLEVFKYMEEENNKRMAVGLSPDLSFLSAYNAMQLENLRNQEQSAADEEKTLTRSRGARVGGRAPYTPSNPSKGTIVGAPQGLDDLATAAYYAEA